MSHPAPEDHGAIFAPGDWLVLLLRRPFTIAVAVALALAAAFFWIGRQEPVWQADATLVLRPDPPRDSTLGALSGWSSRARAQAELARLTSREVAARVAGLPSDGMPPEGRAEGAPGLVTEVFDLDLLPGRAFLRRLLGRPATSASVAVSARAHAPGAPATFEVQFLAGNRLRLVDPAAPSGEDLPEERAWRPGVPLAWHGLELVFQSTQELAGKRFRVRRREPEEAVRDLVRRTEAFETEPGSGVLKLSVRDCDPRRAAATANALCRTYLQLESEEVDRRARDLGGRLDGELTRLRSDLDDAQERLVELFRENPLSVSVPESAKFLTLNLADLEVERARSELKQRLLGEAIDELAAGRVEGLARIAEPDTDKATRILIEHLAQLTAQAELQERADSGQLRHVLQTELIEAQEERGRLELELGALERARAAWDEDPQVALGLLGGTGPASTGIGPMTSLLLEKVAHMQAQADELLARGFLEAHPDVRELRQAVASYLAQIERVLERRIASLKAKIEEHDRLTGATREMLEELPGNEQREIVAARTRLAGVVLDHLAKLRSAAQEAARALGSEIDGLRSELAALPVSERAQTEPEQLVAAAKERIAKLLAAREEVRMHAVLAEPSARIVDPAAVPSHRLAPRLGFGLLVAGLLGLCVGLVCAWARERLGPGLATPEDARAAGGGVVAGVLPAVPGLRRGGLERAFEAFREDDPESPWIDDFQAVALFADAGGEGGILGVTSARPGEGKTLVAMGVASSLARAGRKVLLVNAGIKRDLWLRAAGGPAHRTLLDVVAGRASWRETVAPSGQRRLDLTSAGVPGALAVDLLARGARRGLFADLAAEYDVVVADLPALSVGPQVEDLAARLDRVLLVCRACRTPRADVTAACRRLERAGARSGGVVLNEVRRGPWRRVSDRALRRLGLLGEAHLDLGGRAA